MLKAVSGFTTDRASRYLQQMSKHFAHKTAVEYNETDSVVTLPGGVTGRMAARGDQLSFIVEAADAEGLARGRDIIESHIIRFAFREQLKVLDWAESEN
ncbi:MULTISPECIES: DUF2218 domain-containing protein [unclassified Ensifer]|uniref:DUF2218 domain-containing protein n=1 Tax=unclassified Ensifer TaxID=2633371 RepID=UPI000813C392|nr:MULTISPECIES: DUF2218 domain-containing protein [unclassified Ensifer]OCP05503.1 hypothetical protein BC362_13570 [Ensifer sp. LC14]OCP06952.1 hypothetical protein BBX50_22865 [Ensifer sp. LC11]OCP07409.1 hypothetical protein BC374_23080 [Ensifer sp. LC13]OCP31710.1 hypothetical protein BC364_22330 [Ensifer sp. LC499]